MCVGRVWGRGVECGGTCVGGLCVCVGGPVWGVWRDVLGVRVCWGVAVGSVGKRKYRSLRFIIRIPW